MVWLEPLGKVVAIFLLKYLVQITYSCILPPPPPPHPFPCSMSSTYKDLMPQFLRSVRILCVLYKSFMAVRGSDVPVACRVGTQSVSSPSQTPSFSSPQHSVSWHQAPGSVRRTGSFNSILDNPLSPIPPRNRRPHSMLRFGHNRSHSSTQNRHESSPITTEETGSPAEKSKGVSISDPFAELETVWQSLESWFDLVKIEVVRVQQQHPQKHPHQQQQVGEQQDRDGSQQVS